MKTATSILLFLLSIATTAQAQRYSVDWHVVASGGGHSESQEFKVDGTVSETATGRSQSGTYIVEAGFWAGAGGPYCRVSPGNSNGVPPFNGIDVTYSVNFLKGVGSAPPDTCDCRNIGLLAAAADANGDCSFNGIDVTYSINYLKGSDMPPHVCQSCSYRGYLSTRDHSNGKSRGQPSEWLRRQTQ